MADAIAAPAVAIPASVAPAASAAIAAPDAPAAAKLDATKAEASKGEAADGKAEVAAEPRKFKVKVDGAELEVSEEDLVRGYQTREAADKRFKEAAQTKKDSEARYAEVNKVLELMMNDPRAFAAKAKDLGVDPAKLAEEILRPLVEEQIAADEEQLLSPEQLKTRQMEKEIAGYKQKEVEAKKQAEDVEKQKADTIRQAAVEKHTQELGAAIIAALDATTLPKTDETALALAELVQETIERGLPIEPALLARDLETRKWAELNSLAKATGKSGMIDPDVRKLIRKEAIDDPEIREQIRKQAVEEYKKSNPMAAAKPVVGPKNTRAESKKGRTFGSIMRDLQLGKL